MAALSAIAAAPERPAFPTVVPCPVCKQNTLHLFDDLFTDGIWLNCPGCGTHGDIITFGSAVWNTSLPETVVKFSDLKIITPDETERLIAEYDRFYPKLQAAETFVSDAESQVWSHGDDVIACRLRDLGLHHEIKECYGLIGVAHHEQITKVCATLGRSKPTRLRENGASLVFPFHDLPGRLTGFLLLQYTDTGESAQKFVPLTGYARKKAEAGYFLLRASTEPVADIFRGNQFVSDDILWVLRAQCTHLKYRQQFLPLMASYTGPEANSYGVSWAAFPKTPRIFHGVICSPELVSRGCNARGYISVPGPNPNPRPQSRKLAKVIGKLADIRRCADTWPAVLKRVITAQSELAAASFCERLSIPHDKLNQFLTTCGHGFSDGFADRVLASVKTALAAPVKVQRKWIIIERESGWWTQSGLQICTAKPTIKKVIQSDTGARLYAGEILLDGEIIEFTDSARRIEKLGLLRYISAHVAPPGKLIVYDNAWNRRSHLLAMQLHPPELINVSSKLGWDDAANVFRFVRYEITKTGDIRQTVQMPGHTPKDVFPNPTTIAPIQIRALLTTSAENAFVWTVMAHILANLLAPVFHRDCVATALLPEHFNAASEIGAAVNCTIAPTTSIQKNTAGGAVSKIIGNGEWPVFVFNMFSDTVFSRIIPRYHLQPVFLQISRQCAVSATGYGWQSIQPEITHFAADYSALKYVLPAYIQKTLQTRVQKIIGDVNIVDVILEDLHDWLLATYGTTFNLQHARAIIRAPQTAHETLLTELQTAVAQNKIAVLPQPRKRHQSPNYFVRRQDEWWLNRRAVDNYFFMHKSTPINWLHITQLLRQNGAFIREEIIHNMLGICVKTSWCDNLLESAAPLSKKETG